MKAYIIWDELDYDAGELVVFGKTVKEVKNKWFSYFDTDWINFRVKRAPEFDNMENLSHAEFYYERAKEGHYFFDYEQPDVEKCTKEEYIEWFYKTFEEEV